jgi:hypothetical protein
MVKKSSGKTVKSDEAPGEEEEKKDDPDQPPIDDAPLD